MGTRIFFIRLIATILVITATFVSSWYVFTRYKQLSEPSMLISEEDLNNPRLNYSAFEKIIDYFESRKLYSGEEEIIINISEEDPFYQSIDSK